MSKLQFPLQLLLMHILEHALPSLCYFRKCQFVIKETVLFAYCSSLYGP